MLELALIFVAGTLAGGLVLRLWGRRKLPHEPEDRDAGLRRYQQYKDDR